jgi:hypothetical protein
LWRLALALLWVQAWLLVQAVGVATCCASTVKVANSRSTRTSDVPANKYAVSTVKITVSVDPATTATDSASANASAMDRLIGKVSSVAPMLVTEAVLVTEVPTTAVAGVTCKSATVKPKLAGSVPPVMANRENPGTVAS